MAWGQEMVKMFGVGLGDEYPRVEKWPPNYGQKGTFLIFLVAVTVMKYLIEGS